MSPLIQNDLIKLSGDEIKSTILNEARSAKWFSVMADECTDESTMEQMSICITYVKASDGNFDAREEFLGFVDLEKTNAECISASIISFLKDCNLDLNNLLGQGYDGASVKSGKVSGVCTRIQNIQPQALYHETLLYPHPAMTYLI